MPLLHLSVILPIICYFSSLPLRLPSPSLLVSALSFYPLSLSLSLSLPPSLCLSLSPPLSLLHLTGPKTSPLAARFALAQMAVTMTTPLFFQLSLSLPLSLSLFLTAAKKKLNNEDSVFSI